VGFAHACALDRDGSVTCWGSDEHGQLKAPTGRFSQLTAGGWHSCALRQDGTVACWGAGARSGDCGPGQDKKPKGDPGLDCGQAAPPPGVFREIAAGWHHTCGVRANGKVVCWGSDHLGQSSPPGR
jgi:alpha-tubulin suppressor-like RCC1 family protein